MWLTSANNLIYNCISFKSSQWEFKIYFISQKKLRSYLVFVFMSLVEES